MVTLKKLQIGRFTVFDKVELPLASRLNVIIGENGAGKTHLIKLLYVILAHSHANERNKSNSKSQLQRTLAEKLQNVFRPDSLGRLARRQQGRARAEVAAFFSTKGYDLKFSFSTQSNSEVEINKVPVKFLSDAPVYLPTRELLAIYPGFISLYHSRQLEFDETWYDTCVLLGTPALRGPREQQIRKLLEPIEKILGGSVVLDNSGRFYLRTPGIGNIEMHLLAEGLRKFAMIARLVATGTLLDKGYLFWDEPEANLNPRLVCAAARVIVELAKAGIQVFIATHSLFLLREIEILLHDQFNSALIKNKAAQFIGLVMRDGSVDVETSTVLSGIKTIVALEESLKQSDRYLSII